MKSTFIWNSKIIQKRIFFRVFKNGTLIRRPLSNSMDLPLFRNRLRLAVLEHSRIAQETLTCDISDFVKLKVTSIFSHSIVLGSNLVTSEPVIGGYWGTFSNYARNPYMRHSEMVPLLKSLSFILLTVT